MSNRIFIISDHLMFSYGLECLLLQEKGVEVVGREVSLNSAINALKSLQPDVIIVDDDEITLETIADLLRLIQGNSDGKIIHVSLQSNNVYVYQAGYTQVQRVEDLIEAIKEI